MLSYPLDPANAVSTTYAFPSYLPLRLFSSSVCTRLISLLRCAPLPPGPACLTAAFLRRTSFLEAEVLPCYLTCERRHGYRMVKKLTSVIDRMRKGKSAKADTPPRRGSPAPRHST